jgi:hypothetical protein|tara:strand:- start:3176 stop:3439 length:264 start_codon:yes stop_codon:yes gene_type:complete
MTRQQATKNINAQPVGRATLIVNDKCGDPTNYLYKINYLALHVPQVVRSLAIDIWLADSASKRFNMEWTSDKARRLVDIYYNYQRNR